MSGEGTYRGGYLYDKSKSGNDVNVPISGDEKGVYVQIQEKVCIGSYTQNSEDYQNDILTVPESTRVELINDGTDSFDLEINGTSREIKSGENYGQNFAKFITIGLSGTNPLFRLEVLK